VFQVDFDANRIGFQELMDLFWESHNPCGPVWSNQYRTILFYHDDEQQDVAEAAARAVGRKLRDKVTTAVMPVGTFTVAEDYHQKYRLRRRADLVEDLLAIYPTQAELRESTAAAKINAHLDGFLDYDELERELAALGLEAEGAKRLEGVRRAKD